MPIPPRLFMDACVLVAAANSPDGGSARLLEIAGEERVRLVAARLVMHEAKTNIIGLLGRPAWLWFCRIIGPLRLSLADPPTKEEKEVWAKITPPKDAHVLAGAIKGRSHFLVTLDRWHILNSFVQEAFPIPVLSPGDFLQKFGFTSLRPPPGHKKQTVRGFRMGL